MKRRTENGILRNISINRVLTPRCSIQNYWKRSLTDKERGKTKKATRNFLRFEFDKKTSVPNTVKSLGSISARASAALDQLKPLATVSDTTVKRFAIEREDQKPY